MTARIAPAEAPFPPDIQAVFDRTMPPGLPPLLLFTTLAREPRLFHKFFAASLLDKGGLTLRQRELVIDRTTALCQSEYEWGVHITVFAQKAGFSAEQVASLACGDGDDACWPDDERDLLRLCDSLHAGCSVDDALWQRLSAQFPDEALLELLMLAGFYRTVSYLTNALQLPPEAYAGRFPQAAQAPKSQVNDTSAT